MDRTESPRRLQGIARSPHHPHIRTHAAGEFLDECALARARLTTYEYDPASARFNFLQLPGELIEMVLPLE